MLPALNLPVKGQAESVPKSMATRSLIVSLNQRFLSEAQVSGVPTTNLGQFILGYSRDVHKDYVIISDKFGGRMYHMTHFKDLDSHRRMGRIIVDGHYFLEEGTEIQIYHS